jgi:hypothetical protein
MVDVQRDFALICARARNTRHIAGCLQYIQQRLVYLYREQHYPIIHAIITLLYRCSNVDIYRIRSTNNGKQVVIPRVIDSTEIID